MNRKLRELTEEEPEQVAGGSSGDLDIQIGSEYITTVKIIE